MIKKINIIVYLFVFLSAFDSSKFNKAIELYNLSKYKEAINLLIELSKEYPEEPEVHLWLSKSYEAIFELNESIKENKIYQKLKYLKEKKEKDNENLKIESKKEVETEVKSKNLENIDIDFYQEDLFDYSKLTLITPDLISNIILERKNLSLDDDKKPLDSEEIMDIIFNQKDNSIFTELEIKKNYLIATHQEEIIYKKIEIENILSEINYLNSRFVNELNTEKKSELNLSLKRLATTYHKKLKDLITLINKPVYTNTDPLSFEHFLHTKTNKEVFLRTMLNKKDTLKNHLNEIELNIKNYSTALKDNNKKLEIENKLKYLTLEKNILENAINKIDKTILKIKNLN